MRKYPPRRPPRIPVWGPRGVAAQSPAPTASPSTRHVRRVRLPRVRDQPVRLGPFTITPTGSCTRSRPTACASRPRARCSSTPATPGRARAGRPGQRRGPAALRGGVRRGRRQPRRPAPDRQQAGAPPPRRGRAAACSPTSRHGTTRTSRWPSPGGLRRSPRGRGHRVDYDLGWGGGPKPLWGWPPPPHDEDRRSPCVPLSPVVAMTSLELLSAASSGTYVHVGVFNLSVTSALIIGAMVVVFVVALLAPFPGTQRIGQPRMTAMPALRSTAVRGGGPRPTTGPPGCAAGSAAWSRRARRCRTGSRPTSPRGSTSSEC